MTNIGRGGGKIEKSKSKKFERTYYLKTPMRSGSLMVKGLKLQKKDMYENNTFSNFFFNFYL